ncbi:K(+)-transporting ATPase subunit C [Dermatobacter hominis]|uniref:K(+)-transporting ATPase subunit C n=1 Tax=Dermatobacter hominis TaxID=2884263 RepID=UPI001D10C483|nr:K(+)-transporting ATPase subunit C [Dermatobacter hominis]UDY34561.1 K(+)-transporting ATPase subunit C [Dermatobacter hominis]
MRQQLRSFARQSVPAVVVLLALTVVCGLAYPLLVTGVAEAAFHDKAEGSLLTDGDTVVGSSLLGQGFAAPAYFHPRPSAAGAGYDGTASSGSNLGPTNPDYLATVAERAEQYRAENRLSPEVEVPADAVQASGSGLDPQISIANARLQAPRVAEERGMDLDDVLALVDAHTQGRPLGILGDPGVNVLELNLALDRAG